MEFERAIRSRITNAKTESAKKKYTRLNPVYDKYDLVQPDNHLYGKLAAAFSGLVFMVRGGHVCDSDCGHSLPSHPHHPSHSSLSPPLTLTTTHLHHPSP